VNSSRLSLGLSGARPARMARTEAARVGLCRLETARTSCSGVVHTFGMFPRNFHICHRKIGKRALNTFASSAVRCRVFFPESYQLIEYTFLSQI